MLSGRRLTVSRGTSLLQTQLQGHGATLCADAQGTQGGVLTEPSAERLWERPPCRSISGFRASCEGVVVTSGLVGGPDPAQDDSMGKKCPQEEHHVVAALIRPMPLTSLGTTKGSALGQRVGPCSHPHTLLLSVSHRLCLSLSAPLILSYSNHISLWCLSARGPLTCSRTAQDSGICVPPQVSGTSSPG